MPKQRPTDFPDVTGQGSRLDPPATLSAAERDLWQTIVDSRSPRWFDESNQHLLVEYVQKHTLTKKMAAEIAAYKKVPTAAAELGHYLGLVEATCRVTLTMIRLATALRLTPATCWTRDKNPTSPIRQV